jgi:hypothetical protein
MMVEKRILKDCWFVGVGILGFIDEFESLSGETSFIPLRRNLGLENYVTSIR